MSSTDYGFKMKVLQAAQKIITPLGETPLTPINTKESNSALIAVILSELKESTCKKMTAAKSTATTSGTVSNAYSVTFITSSNFVGTIAGDAAGASTEYKWEAIGGLADIAYTITAGSIEIMTLS